MDSKQRPEAPSKNGTLPRHDDPSTTAQTPQPNGQAERAPDADFPAQRDDEGGDEGGDEAASLESSAVEFAVDPKPAPPADATTDAAADATADATGDATGEPAEDAAVDAAEQQGHTHLDELATALADLLAESAGELAESARAVHSVASEDAAVDDPATDDPAVDAGDATAATVDAATGDTESEDTESEDTESEDTESEDTESEDTESGHTETGEPAVVLDARSPLVMNAVKIRGRPGGVAIEIGGGDWSQLIKVLRQRLDIAEGFFRGGRVVLDVGERVLQAADLQAACDVLTEHEMEMAVVRAGAHDTQEAAARLGIASTTVAAEDPLRGVVEAHAAEEAVREPTAYYVHQGNLRSGQVLERGESVIVIGDVNPGAQVVSHGDVLIYGRLRGSVHAGAEGDDQAMVTALEFAPTQLRIAGLTSVPPEDKKSSAGLLFWRKDNHEPGAEYAYAADGRIYVEPWNAARPGSLTARRRR